MNLENAVVSQISDTGTTNLIRPVPNIHKIQPAANDVTPKRVKTLQKRHESVKYCSWPNIRTNFYNFSPAYSKLVRETVIYFHIFDPTHTTSQYSGMTSNSTGINSVKTSGSSRVVLFLKTVSIIVFSTDIESLIILTDRYIFNSKLYPFGTYLAQFYHCLTCIVCWKPPFEFTNFRFRLSWDFRPSSALNRNVRTSFVGLTMPDKTSASFGE